MSSPTIGNTPRCRSCGAGLDVTFVDLGESPLANSYVHPDRFDEIDRTYPLHARVCRECLLVQVETVVSPTEIFSDYAYFSSVSESWLAHARSFAAAAIRARALTERSLVVEVASNDGYLLRYFHEAGIVVLGIEPAANVAAAALANGVTTRIQFFNTTTASELVSEGKRADLLVANNVLAHVPDLNDFLEGARLLLAPEGALSIEVPHLLRLIEGVQFDTIYHEHFSYFSLLSLERALARHQLAVFDVERLWTHGGSLRVWVTHAANDWPEGESVPTVRDEEHAAGLCELSTYSSFPAQVEECRRSLREFLTVARQQGRSVIGYGAAAKATTLLNYCGVTADEIEFVVDRSPHKQGLYLPGNRIRILPPEAVAERRPGYLLIFAWNLLPEIKEQMAHVRDWGGTLVVPVPITTEVSWT